MSPKMHNKQINKIINKFSPGVLYSGHELNYVLFHNRKSHFHLKTHNIFMLLYDKQFENYSDLNDNDKI